jgi:hypothetical protein
MQPDPTPNPGPPPGRKPGMEHAVEVWLVDMRQAWPVLLARAVFAVAFGLVALIWPTITLLILAWAFGIFAIIDGAMQIIDGIRRRDRPRWWISLLLGLLELAAGVLALIWPGISAVALAIVVGAWALVTGLIEIFSPAASRAAPVRTAAARRVGLGSGRRGDPGLAGPRRGRAGGAGRRVRRGVRHLARGAGPAAAQCRTGDHGIFPGPGLSLTGSPIDGAVARSNLRPGSRCKLGVPSREEFAMGAIAGGGARAAAPGKAYRDRRPMPEVTGGQPVEEPVKIRYFRRSDTSVIMAAA